MTVQSEQHFFEPETFPARHIGPTEAEIQEMLGVLGLASLDALIQATIPDNIRLKKPMSLHGQRTRCFERTQKVGAEKLRISVFYRNGLL